MPTEQRLIEDIQQSLRRLDAAVKAEDHAEAASQLSFLSSCTVSVAVLKATGVGVAVSKLRAYGASNVSSLAQSLVAQWRRVAEEAGVSSRKDKPAPKPAPPGSASAAAPPATAGAAVGPVDRSANAGPTIAALGPGRQRVAEKFKIEFIAAVGSTVGFLTAADTVALQQRLEAVRADAERLAAYSVETFSGGTATEAAEESEAVSTTAPAPKPNRSSSATAAEPSYASVGSGNCSGGGGGDATLAQLLERQTVGDVAAQAERVACQLEAALHDRTRAEARPQDAYAERFRVLIMGLHRNAALALNVYQGVLDCGAVAAMSADDMVSDAHRLEALELRQKFEESIQLDWKAKNRTKVLASLGYSVADGILKCGKCGSRNTDFTERQTRSADEPTTKFACCYACNHRWKFC